MVNKSALRALLNRSAKANQLKHQLNPNSHLNQCLNITLNLINSQMISTNLNTMAMARSITHPNTTLPQF